MRHEVSKELYAYWNTIRADRSVPERNDVEPGAIRGILPDTFVLDFDESDGFPFRIAGSRVQTLFQTELLAFPFLHLWREADRRELKSLLLRIADDAQPCLIDAEARPPGLAPAEVQALLLPLSHQGSTRSRILGSLAVIGSADWLGLIGSGPVTLTGARAVDPAAARQAAPPFALEADPHRRGSGDGRAHSVPFWRRRA